MVSESKSTPVPYSVLLPEPKPDSPVNLPMAVTKVAKPITTKARAKTAARNKKNARMISRMERNKSKPPAKTEPIMVSEDSDSSIERFLAEEGFCGDEPPHDFVENLPPCLRDNPDFPGIKPPYKTLGESSNPPSAQKVCFTLRPVWTVVREILLGCPKIVIQNSRFGKPSGKAHWSECKSAA
jgi:hypothetical protein